MILAVAIGTPSRFKQVDLSANWYQGPFATLVPYPKEKLNVTAPFKPLSYEVITPKQQNDICSVYYSTTQFCFIGLAFNSLFGYKRHCVLKWGEHS